MSFAHRLKAKHAELDQRIAAERVRPYPDTIALQSFKRRKLRIKDRLVALSAPLQSGVRR
jgi:hypothetical protein